MCIKCGYTTATQEDAMNSLAKMQFASGIANMAGGIIGDFMNCIFDGKDDETSETKTRRSENRGRNQEVKETPTTTKEQENAVKLLLGETKFNSLSDELKSQVLKKYSTITTFAENNGLKISDEEMTNRLTNYIKALESHQQQLQMGAHVVNGGLANEYNGKSIVDEDVKKQKASGTDEQYFQSLLDRGNGTVQLYDTNGDNLVSKEEFIAREAGDWKRLTGENLTDDMKTETEKYFNKIDKNKDGIIDSAEFGTHEYARATLGDTDKNSNEELTFKEWYLGQQITSNSKIESRYDYASNQIYSHLDKAMKDKNS